MVSNGLLIISPFFDKGQLTAHLTCVKSKDPIIVFWGTCIFLRLPKEKQAFDSLCDQSHYIKVASSVIFIEQNLRFGQVFVPVGGNTETSLN